MNLSLIKNFVTLAGAESLSKVVTFAVFAYLARVYGPSGFGYIEWAAAILMCASLIVDQGFSSYGAREIAKKPDSTATLVREIVTTRLLLAAIGYCAIVIFALSFVEVNAVVTLLLVYGLSLWGLPFLLMWVFQGHDRMHLVAIAQVIRQTVFAAVIFGFVRDADDLVLVGVAEICGVAAAGLFCVFFYRKDFAEKMPLRPALSKRLLVEGVPIGLSQMFWVVKTFGATLIIGLVATSEDTGFFAGAMRIYIALHTFVWLYYFNLLPSMSRSWENGPGEFRTLIRNSMAIVTLLSLVGGIVWILLAPMGMRLAYGAQFDPGGVALQWLGGACIAAAVNGHFRFGLISAGYQKQEMYTAAIGALVTICSLPFAYVYFGVAGAGAALFFVEALVLILSWAYSQVLLFGTRDVYQENNPKPVEL